MKSLLLVLTLSLFGLSFTVSVESGSITYTRSTVIDFTVQESEEPTNDKIAAQLSAMNAAGAFDKQYRATFRPGAFRFDELPREQITKTLPGGITLEIMDNGFYSCHYTDLTERTFTNSVEIADKPFLVSGDAPVLDWQLIDPPVLAATTQTGIDLQYATAVTADRDTVTAGYAPSLPVDVGPENYFGLPGAILTLRVKNGQRHFQYIASSIDLTTEVPEIAVPTEGKAITMEKFRALRDKVRKRDDRNFIMETHRN